MATKRVELFAVTVMQVGEVFTQAAALDTLRKAVRACEAAGVRVIATPVYVVDANPDPHDSDSRADVRAAYATAAGEVAGGRGGERKGGISGKSVRTNVV